MLERVCWLMSHGDKLFTQKRNSMMFGLSCEGIGNKAICRAIYWAKFFQFHEKMQESGEHKVEEHVSWIGELVP